METPDIPLAVTIMAAGKGTRMKSDLPKALHELAGRPLLAHVIDTARELNPERIVVIVGHGRERVMEQFADAGVDFVTQEPQLGTGHAIARTEAALRDFGGCVVTLSGDVPLLRADTIRAMIAEHRAAGAAVTVLTCELDEPGAYGRIIRENGRVTANVEARDASPEQLAVREINAGVYVFDARFLYPALKRLTNDNVQGEYYLTDLIGLAVAGGRAVAGVVARDPSEIEGVNTVAQLEAMEARLRGG